MKNMTRILASLALFSAAGSSYATEGGNLAVYPDGFENFMVAAVPPPGFHFLMYAGSMTYDKLRGNDGQSLIDDFKVNASVIAPRFIWVTKGFAGGDFVVHAITPLLDMKFRANGMEFKKRGLGDITVGAGLAFHPSQDLHYLFGVDVIMPTGKYDQDNPASLGKNYWAVQPMYGISYAPVQGINADLKLMYDFNFKNKDTDTRSGQAVHADYALGWGFGNGWVAGASGYIFRQVTDDHGPNSAQGRSRAAGLGPSLRYGNQDGWLFTLKWQKEFVVANRPEGSQLYAKLAIPF